MRSNRFVPVPLLLLLATTAVAGPSMRPHEQTGWAGSGPATKAPPVHATSVAVAVVNDDWTGYVTGTPVTVGVTGYVIGTDAFATVQAGIDAVGAGGTVKVLPGNYSETASGRFLYDASGPYQFGLFVDQTKTNVSVVGVDAAGNPLIGWAIVQATITTNATNSFGPSGIFVEGDGVTLAGLRIGTNTAGQNKTIEVIGDDFRLQGCDIADLYGSVYVNDFRYDAGLNVSHVKAYRIEGCRFQDGVSLDLASGAGYSGPVSGRVVTGNEFHNDASSFWPSISFNGSGTGVPWFLYSVGGAQINGNQFFNAYPEGQLVRARGSYDNSQFDWTSYFYLNSFDRAVVVGPGYPEIARTYTYTSGPYTFANVRRIGSAIQPEVLHGVSGDQVVARAGTYVEQVVIDGLNLTLQGGGRTQTIVRSPAVLATSFATPTVRKPVVLVRNAASVVVRDLTVDGADQGNANNSFVGVAYWNAGGQLVSCDVVRVQDSPFSGVQHGVGLYAGADAPGPPGSFSVSVAWCNFSDFQKTGLVFNSARVYAFMVGCTVAGKGPTAITAQNGIQFSFGAYGLVRDCAVAGTYYTGPTYTATGQLFYQAGTVDVEGGTVTACQTGTYYIDADGSMTGTNTTTPVAGGIGAWGVATYNSTSTPAPDKAASRDRPVAEPFPADGDDGVRATSTYSVTLAGGCITGPGVAGTEGVEGWSEGGPYNMTLSNLEISGWGWGVYVGGAGGVNMNAFDNAITGNLTAGYEGVAGHTHLAANNWWGSPLGPGLGGANPVIGPVTTSPWRASGADLNPGCGFSPAPVNTIAPGSPTACITPANPCVAVPVTITRSGADPVRGFSVDVTLSPNLTLCGASFAIGGYLIGGTNFQWYASGPNTWTVDGATLGLPCGATAPTGVLFTVYVASAAPSGTGTVTLANAQLRDCSNVPLAAGVGAPATVTIQNTLPTAIANLAAVQQTAGNDADGTTKVAITFTPPPGAANVAVFRKGFGSYPEYDDPPTPGGPPAAPGAYPPAGWAATTVTASGQTDEPATRDWWYYVAYVQDACGNWSVASNVTTGTLDYHLGDVSDGFTAGQGNNAVDMADVSLLGANYGITISSPHAVNYLDVGPTTTNFVNGRPLTDNKVNFEDLMMFAINFSVVSAPATASRVAADGADALSVDAPNAVTAGAPFKVRLRLHGSGVLQGISSQLAWDPAVAEPVSVEPGEMPGTQHGVVMSATPGGVDAAMLGVRGSGFAGDGVLATVTFRAKGTGDPRVRLARTEGRDAQNRPVSLGTLSAPNPVTTALAPAQPNPFRSGTTLAWSLGRTGAVELALFSVDGRRVRTLATGVHEPGEYRTAWNGADDHGRRLGAGLYFVRLQTPEGVLRRTVTLVP